MGSSQQGQAAQDRRRCRVCNQLKPLSEYSLKNGRPRRVCKLCRLTQGFRQREEEHQQRVAYLIRELVRLSRRDRLHTPKAAEVVEELVRVAGNAETAAGIWADQLRDTLRTGCRPKAILGQFGLIVDMLKPDKPLGKGPPRKRPSSPKEAPPDFSAMSDQELRAGIELCEARKRRKARVGSGQTEAIT